PNSAIAEIVKSEPARNTRTWWRRVERGRIMMVLLEGLSSEVFKRTSRMVTSRGAQVQQPARTGMPRRRLALGACVERCFEKFPAQVADLASEHGEPISLEFRFERPDQRGRSILAHQCRHGRDEP